MIKQLYDYFQVHKNDKDINFPSYGYADQKAPYCLDINLAGEFISFQVANKPARLPDMGVRTSGVKACYFHDNLKYVWGCAIQGKEIVYNVHKNGSKNLDQFILQHQDIYDKTHVPELLALTVFLTSWRDCADPIIKEALDKAVSDNKYRDGFILLRVGGKYLHEIPRLVKYWEGINKSPDITGFCTITGKVGGLKKCHGKIKGVQGTAPTGGSFVSFNRPSHVSYDADIAPISCEAEFGYRTVLNYFLTGPDTNHRSVLGEDTVVLWTSRKKNGLICRIVNYILNKNEEETEAILKNAIEAIRNGIMPDLPTEEGPADDRFCLAVLSGNNGRIYMRHFFEHTIEDIVKKIHQHVKDIAIDPYQISLKSLAWACIGNGSNEIPHKSIYQALLQSVLEGEQYPYHAVHTSIEICLKPKGMRRSRIALVKGYLNRKYRKEGRKEFDMGLDEEATGIGYLLGRFLVVANEIQEASIGHGGPNKSFNDRYRASLGTTPGMMLKDLDDKVQAHLAKLRRINRGLYVYFSKKLSQIVCKMDQVPLMLSMEQQAEYVLGLYHQTQERYKKSAN
jgi:CRISPR-associated protein Csd1